MARIGDRGAIEKFHSFHMGEYRRVSSVMDRDYVGVEVWNVGGVAENESESFVGHWVRCPHYGITVALNLNESIACKDCAVFCWRPGRSDEAIFVINDVYVCTRVKNEKECLRGYG